MRSANQIIALTEVREKFESTEFHAAVTFAMREFPKLAGDAEMRRKMLEPSLPKEFEQARMLANFLENLGVFVKHRALDRTITCDMWGDTVLRSWDRLAPLVANRRHVAGNPALFENFEYLAVLCKQFKRRHPNGTYPRGFERMPAAQIWPEAR
jgi:hypothetical protein